MIEYNMLLEFVDIDVRQAPPSEIVDDVGELFIVARVLLTKTAKKKAQVITTKEMQRRLLIHTRDSLQRSDCKSASMMPPT